MQPSFIRVDADEVTYPAHVIMRFEIERGLIEGRYEVEDIPALWDEQMMALLGVDTRGNFRDGPMQDVHWPEGLFGYFACYSLGAMYAAQWFATMRRQMPDLDAQIGAGNLDAGLRLAAREHLAAGQPLDDRRARNPRLGRDAESGALQGASREALPGLRVDRERRRAARDRRS